MTVTPTSIKEETPLKKVSLKKPPLKIVLPVAIVVGFGLIAWLIMLNPSQAEKHGGKRRTEMSVEVETVKLSNYQIQVTSFGVVRPRTESTLAAQVSGMVIEVSEKFQEGAFFEEGDLLLKIESRDYLSAVIIAESDYVQANYQLSEEKARGKQAVTNWRRMGSVNKLSTLSSDATDLVLRKPQMAAAQAKSASAKARLEQAKLDLERTHLRAPYAGRVLKRNVDRGQVITANTPVADIYAVDYLEVRLPLSGRQREYVFIPEQYRYQRASLEPAADKSETAVKLQAHVGRNSYLWSGTITRAEGALDATSRQLNVIVQVDDPYDLRQDHAPPLKIGQFVEATIAGELLQDVFVLPHGAVNEDSYVFVVENGHLLKKQVEVIWSDDDRAVVSKDLKSLTVGDLLVTSPIGNATTGTPVTISVVPIYEANQKKTIDKETIDKKGID